MKIIKINSIQKEVSYKETIKVAGNSYKKRIIFELEIKTDHGVIQSELSLLKDFHQRSYDEALKAYQKPEDFLSWDPQIKYPIEIALFQLSRNQEKKSKVKINSYYDPSIVNTLINQNYTYKIKLGRTTLDSEIELLEKIDHENLRLDANLTLDEKSFRKYLEVLKNYDYFEEPFKNTDEYKKFPNERFALDENVQNSKLQNLDSVKAFVIKPSLLGLDKSLELIRLAKKMGKRVIISSTFEGELGHLGLARLASYSDEYLGYREEHGLGTISFLSQQLNRLGICVTKNSIELHF